jgi:hypothetical protein
MAAPCCSAAKGPRGASESRASRLLVGEQGDDERLARVLRAGGRARHGLGEARRPLRVPGVELGGEGGPVHQAAVAAQRQLPLLVRDPERGALRVGDPGEHGEDQVLQPLHVQGGQDLQPLPVERLGAGEVQVLGEQPRVLAPEPHPRERAAAHVDELLPVHRLGEEVGAARLHRLHGEPHVVVAGDGERLEVRIALARLAHERDAVEPGHHHVGEEHVEALLGHEPQRLVAGGGHAHLVAGRLEQLPEQLLEEALVVDDDDPPGGEGGH